MAVAQEYSCSDAAISSSSSSLASTGSSTGSFSSSSAGFCSVRILVHLMTKSSLVSPPLLLVVVLLLEEVIRMCCVFCGDKEVMAEVSDTSAWFVLIRRSGKLLKRRKDRVLLLFGWTGLLVALPFLRFFELPMVEVERVEGLLRLNRGKRKGCLGCPALAGEGGRCCWSWSSLTIMGAFSTVEEVLPELLMSRILPLYRCDICLVQLIALRRVVCIDWYWS